MAFLRIERKSSGSYLRIVQSYKDEQGKSRHKTLYSLGKVEDYPPEQLENIGKKLLQAAGLSLEEIIPQTFEEVGRYNYGYILALRKLWELFNLNEWARRVGGRRKHKMDWTSALELMIAERLADPVSKLQSSFNQEEYLGLREKPINLQHLYRTLDILRDEADSLKKHLFDQQRSLFSQQLDVVFYDVTTLYFDSQKEQEDSLRQKGYSKDGKAHKTQVVLGLLVDKLRNPISFDIYRGNTSEGSTIENALIRLKKDYQIDRVVLVADSAMVRKSNRELISGFEYDYIIAERLKNLPKKLISKLIDKSKHKALAIQKEIFSYSEINHEGRRLICTYSAKRARKDAAQRAKLLEKAEALITNPSKLKQQRKRGAARYVTEDGTGGALRLDTDKLMADARFDGFKVITTNSEMGVESILTRYKDLWEVEHAFRTLKSTLEIRPMFHWTNKRIIGHVIMCFIAYTFLNYLRNKAGMQLREIIKALNSMQMSAVRTNDNQELVYIRSSINEHQQKLFKALKITPPRDANPQISINQLFM
ncbi:MAG: IS1634 family transposase [Saprospirales bacterium]|nr:MAG: IS1634 family transposase [Saprospirales bacterium]